VLRRDPYVDEVVLQILKYFFLSLIFLFLARAVRAMYLEIYGPRTARVAAPSPARVSMPKTSKRAERLVVTAPGVAAKEYEIQDELIIGRAEKCQVVLTDAYSSQVHARVFRRDDELFLEDMGSTNGTYLNQKKVTAAQPVARGDKARIGKTEMEFKR